MATKTLTLPGRDGTTVPGALDAFQTSRWCANPTTSCGYVGVLDQLLTELGTDRPRAAIDGDELAGLLEHLWGHRARRP